MIQNILDAQFKVLGNIFTQKRYHYDTVDIKHKMGVSSFVAQDKEQLGKLERSGLSGFFHAREVVSEKSVETYRDIIAKHRLSPGQIPDLMAA